MSKVTIRKNKTTGKYEVFEDGDKCHWIKGSVSKTYVQKLAKERRQELINEADIQPY